MQRKTVSHLFKHVVLKELRKAACAVNFPATFLQFPPFLLQFSSNFPHFMTIGLDALTAIPPSPMLCLVCPWCCGAGALKP